MNKIIKNIARIVIPAAFAVCLSGCGEIDMCKQAEKNLAEAHTLVSYGTKKDTLQAGEILDRDQFGGQTRPGLIAELANEYKGSDDNDQYLKWHDILQAYRDSLGHKN